MIAKIQTSVDTMDKITPDINNIYAAGAVEGYTEKNPGYISHIPNKSSDVIAISR